VLNASKHESDLNFQIRRFLFQVKGRVAFPRGNLSVPGILGG